jgi:hypothetical protein
VLRALDSAEGWTQSERRRRRSRTKPILHDPERRRLNLAMFDYGAHNAPEEVAA